MPFERFKTNSKTIIWEKDLSDLSGFIKLLVLFKDSEEDQPRAKLQKRVDACSEQEPTIQKTIPQIETLDCPLSYSDFKVTNFNVNKKARRLRNWGTITIKMTAKMFGYKC